MIIKVKKRLFGLLRKSDFKRNPLKAIIKRILWRIKWFIADNTWIILKTSSNYKLAVPKGGAGALIYYQGHSEPEVVNFITFYLRTGMVFIDIGAHIREYTILASTIVGEKGEIHAFEPDPRNFLILQKNLEINHVKNVVLNQIAVSDTDGKVKFLMFPEPSISRICYTNKSNNKTTLETFVDAVRLDKYILDYALDRVNLKKIDVEGAELFVFRGAQSLLQQPSELAPVILFEYSVKNCQRFGYHPRQILELLYEKRYKIWWLREDFSLQLIKKGSLPNISDIHHCILVAGKDSHVIR